jgi:biopolymer transport protein ExbD
MSLDLFPKRHRKGPLELQLTAMIDVFSMIVIFLIFGTVFGAADIVIPSGMQIPKSLSKEGIESAPRIAILNNQVSFSLNDSTVPLSEFRSYESRENLVRKLTQSASAYLEKQKEAKKPVSPLNLVADQSTSYQDIFDVVVVFRRIGFNSILFVAMGQGVKQ